MTQWSWPKALEQFCSFLPWNVTLCGKYAGGGGEGKGFMVLDFRSALKISNLEVRPPKCAVHSLIYFNIKHDIRGGHPTKYQLPSPRFTIGRSMDQYIRIKWNRKTSLVIFRRNLTFSFKQNMVSMKLASQSLRCWIFISSSLKPDFRLFNRTAYKRGLFVLLRFW